MITGAAPTPADGHRASRFSWLFGKLSIFGLITAVATATTVALIWFPDLKRDPETELSAALRLVAFEPGVTYGDYLIRTGQVKPPETNGRITGNLFYVEISAQGLKRRQGELRACLYDATQRKRIHAYSCHIETRVSPGTTSDRFIVPVWVQPPVDEGRYYVRFQFRGKGVLLAIADSRRFGPCRTPACGAPLP